MVLASGFIGLDRANAWKIFKRDRKNHASPNSAQTEAVMAGALRVQLAGDAWYFGKLYKKPTILGMIKTSGVRGYQESQPASLCDGAPVTAGIFTREVSGALGIKRRKE